MRGEEGYVVFSKNSVRVLRAGSLLCSQLPVLTWRHHSDEHLEVDPLPTFLLKTLFKNRIFLFYFIFIPTGLHFMGATAPTLVLWSDVAAGAGVRHGVSLSVLLALPHPVHRS